MRVYCGMNFATGEDSRVQLLMRDDTVVTIGPDSELGIQEILDIPENKPDGFVTAVTKGVFRFVTGKITDPADFQVKLTGLGTIGTRGTDWQLILNSDHSASINMASGVVDYTELATSSVTTVSAGEMLKIDATGKASGPFPIDVTQIDWLPISSQPTTQEQATPVRPAPVSEPVASGDQTTAMRRDYELAAQIGNSAAWQAFLRQYQTGYYADLARAQLAKTGMSNH